MGFIDVIKEKSEKQTKKTNCNFRRQKNKENLRSSRGSAQKKVQAKSCSRGKQKKRLRKNGAGFDISGATIVDPDNI